MAVTFEGCQYITVAHILAPRFQLLRTQLASVGNLSQCVPHGVRSEVGEPDPGKSYFEDFANWRCIGPMLAAETADSEVALFIWQHRRLREQGVAGTVELFGRQILHPS